MPGIVLTFGAARVVERHEAATEAIPTEPGYVSLELVHTLHARAHLIAPDSYAWSCFSAHDYTVILDGLIYNLDAGDVEQQLRTIARMVTLGEDPHPAVRSFVDRCDGVFNVFVYCPAGPSLLVFNDRWGRLPLFHSCTSDRVVITREPKFAFPFLPEIVFNRYAIAEFILCGFVLGDKILVRGISHIPPSTMLIATIKDGAVRTTVEQVLPVSFAESNRSIPQEEIVRTVHKLLLSSTASRVRTLQGLGYKLTADLSGGFDTRAVFSALCATGADVEFRTDALFTGDEALYARRVAGLFGREVRSLAASVSLKPSSSEYHAANEDSAR